MYSGTTLTRASGRIIGAHQKIDRLADKQLYMLIGDNKQFPKINKILHFEGNNGPDGIKRKSPSQNEPKHFFLPYEEDDVVLLEILESHFKRLVASLVQKDEIRSAFEAAWLAHAIVDGLTPAHQFPYDEKLAELRKDKDSNKPHSVMDKIMMPGATIYDMIDNNWKFWGPKGLFMTHAAFEMGVATLIKPLKFNQSLCLDEDMFVVNSKNIAEWYREVAQKVADMGLYVEFYEKGWTRHLASEVRQQLIPILVRTVTLSWYGAVIQADIG